MLSIAAYLSPLKAHEIKIEAYLGSLKQANVLIAIQVPLGHL